MLQHRRLNKLGNKLFSVIFVTVLVGITLLSSAKLLHFYMYQETDYNEWSIEAGNRIETDFITNFWQKYNYVNFNGLIERMLGHHEMNNVVKLDNGYLLQPLKKEDDSTLMTYAEEISAFGNKLSDKGIQYLYVTLPYVRDKYQDELPKDIEDYGNDNMDRLKQYLEANGVDNIDLRDLLHEDGHTTYDYYYRTDHHWTTEGGFYAYQKIMEHLKETEGIDVGDQVTNLDNYEIINYPKRHLGSCGQRTGKYYAGIDDFHLIVPKFESNLTRWDYSESGSLQDLALDLSALDEDNNTLHRYTYDNVLEKSAGNYHNPNAPVKKTVLVIGDSMAKAVMPYMLLTFENVRYYKNTDSLEDLNDWYFDNYQPDIVISMYYVERLGHQEAFAFP